MGSRLVLSKMNNISDPLEHALPFLDPIDGNALSEAVMGLKPKGGPNPYFFKHEGVWHLQINGKIKKCDPWRSH